MAKDGGTLLKTASKNFSGKTILYQGVSNMQDAEIVQIIGANIRTRRLELGISQTQLAKAAGVSTSTISSLERAKRTTIILATLEKIMDALGITFAQLLSGIK